MRQAMYPGSNTSVHLDETWSVQGGRSNSVIARKGHARPLDQSGNGQPIRKT